MKKLIFLGVICGLTVSCVKNNDVDARQAFIDRGVNTCLNKMKTNKPGNRDYCECVMNGFVNEMSIDELVKYGQDDPKTEQKADKIIEKQGLICKQRYLK